MKIGNAGGGGGTDQFHKMTHGGAEPRISQKIVVTYYLNGP